MTQGIRKAPVGDKYNITDNVDVIATASAPTAVFAVTTSIAATITIAAVAAIAAASAVAVAAVGEDDNYPLCYFSHFSPPPFLYAR